MASDLKVDNSDNSKGKLEFQPIFDTTADANTKPKKAPRRVLHFSDGVLEEYSTDEEDEVEKKIVPESSNQLTAVDSRTMAWGPWFLYQTVVIGTKSLQVCDYLGESLAGFFGITSPKYQFEIDHYNHMLEEEKQHQQEEDLEMGGWRNVKTDETVTV